MPGWDGLFFKDQGLNMVIIDISAVKHIGSGLIRPEGIHNIILTEAEGEKMSSPNFPDMDFKGCLWISNSTARKDTESALQ